MCLCSSWQMLATRVRGCCCGNGVSLKYRSDSKIPRSRNKPHTWLHSRACTHKHACWQALASSLLSSRLRASTCHSQNIIGISYPPCFPLDITNCQKLYFPLLPEKLLLKLISNTGKLNLVFSLSLFESRCGPEAGEIPPRHHHCVLQRNKMSKLEPPSDVRV